LEFHFAHYRLWEAIGIAVESNSPVKNMAALRYLAKCGENAVFPPLEKDQIARLIPFARRQMQTHPDARARALAMRCLGLWDDTESIPALTQALDAPEKPLRLAAAEALILLHHAPLLEKCIERLVEEDEAPDPKHMIWVAQRLGMKNAEQSLRLGLPGGVAATLPNNAKDSASDESTSRSIREMRERRKAVLRRLGGGAPAGAKPQTTLAGPEGIPLDVQRTIDRLASPDAKERAKAGAELGKMGGAGAKALPALLKAIFSDGMWNTMPKDAPFFPEDWAIKQIGRADPVALSDQIQNPDPKISSTVTSYLGEIGGPEAFQALLGAIHHKDSETRRTAIVALGRFKDVRAADSLLELLTSKEQMDRASAVLA
jgi:HEAT repeat protein